MPAGVVASIDNAVEAARAAFSHRADVIEVRAGYRFKRGWITDERVVVVEVRKKLSPTELAASGTVALPSQILGVGVDVRTAALPDQLEHVGIDLAALEAPPDPADTASPPTCRWIRSKGT